MYSIDYGEIREGCGVARIGRNVHVFRFRSTGDAAYTELLAVSLEDLIGTLMAAPWGPHSTPISYPWQERRMYSIDYGEIREGCGVARIGRNVPVFRFRSTGDAAYTELLAVSLEDLIGTLMAAPWDPHSTPISYPWQERRMYSIDYGEIREGCGVARIGRNVPVFRLRSTGDIAYIELLAVPVEDLIGTLMAAPWDPHSTPISYPWQERRMYSIDYGEIREGCGVAQIGRNVPVFRLRLTGDIAGKAVPG